MVIASSQYNFQYGDQIHFPYSIGTLLAYARTQIPDLEILPCAVDRRQFAAHVERAAAADVLLCSCYVWNWELTMRLAAAVKARNPSCTVIAGGPQVPDHVGDLFAAHPYLDAVVHGEGETALSALLAKRAAGESIEREHAVPRLTDLGALPSPYTDGTIDELAEDVRARWVAAWETNRGCPFGCTFCDWGSATYSKTRLFPMDRLTAEMEWFGESGVPYIDCCDANFGMFPRDGEIATRLAETKARHGAPQTFRQSWAKQSSRKLIPIAQTLHDAGLLTAAGLALESLDATTLATIDRKNIPFDSYATLSAEFRAAGLPTYTELIRGLPGETLASFRQGLASLIESAEVGQIYIYPCSVLPNAPLNDPAYRAEHGVEMFRSPIYLAHSTPGADPVTEYERLIFGTATMPHRDLRAAHRLSWIVQLGESLRMFDQIVRGVLEVCTASTPIDAYDTILRLLSHGIGGVFADEYERTSVYLDQIYSGRGWNHVDPRFGPITWPIEEASWLRLAADPEATWTGFVELAAHAADRLGSHPTVVQPVALATKQLARLRTYDGRQPMPDWARDMMWHGRRAGRFLR